VRRIVAATASVALVAALLVAAWLWSLDLGSLGPRRPLPTVGVRSCPVPVHYDRYRSDAAYKAAWDHACEVFATTGIESQPMLEEIGPLGGTLTCDGVWDLAAATCEPTR
jgi:hypothetical protein